MGYIREPEGINFVVENKGLSDAERVLINELIARSKIKRRKRRVSTAVVASPKQKRLAKAVESPTAGKVLKIHLPEKTLVAQDDLVVELG